MNSPRELPKTATLPRALYRAAQVREFDRIVIEDYGIRGEILMQRAGQAAFDVLVERWPEARDVTVVVGTGNNGGDGFVVAQLAQAAGLMVRVLQLGDRERLSPDAAIHARRFAEAGGDWRLYAGLPKRTDLIVDGLLGTGLERAVAGRWAEAVEAINNQAAPVLALDIPSGLHSDTGAVLGTAVRATATVSFIALKQGLFTGDGPAQCGAIEFAALEVPARVFGSAILAARRLDQGTLRGRFPRRVGNAHKGHYGHVLVVGGDSGFGGAARLASEAAARTGAGLVSLATRPEHVAAVLATRPEIMAHPVATPSDVEALLERVSVIAIGPGIGHGAWGEGLWERARQSGLPMVIDADALRWLPTTEEPRSDWVITPHPGEAARLLAVTVAEVQGNRFDACARLVARFGGTAVLKGAGTLVQTRGSTPVGVCTCGNPGMASGGMGDVLTGIIAGLLAQGYAAAEAAELGVCLHAAAADQAASRGMRGMLASDLFEPLRQLVNPL